jgi:hypothetical protein
VTYIPHALRHLVSERADHRCEYCLLPEEFSTFPHEPDHIISLKHNGPTTADNLALACYWCNRLKGSDLASLDPQTNQITSLFNPRQHIWSDHFHLDDAMIVPLTPEGRVTAALLKFNRADRLTARQVLFEAGYYP